MTKLTDTKTLEIYTKKTEAELKKFYKKKYKVNNVIVSYQGKENKNGKSYIIMMFNKK